MSEHLDGVVESSAPPADQWSGDRAVSIVAGWARLLAEPDQVLELRTLRCADRNRAITIAGFYDYDHLDSLARRALQLTTSAEGVYITLNPLNPALLARRANKAVPAEQGVSAADKDVICRRRLLVDIDPVRPAGISSSDAEKALALEAILAVREFLRARAWPEPVLADSGNGYHLLYWIDLPADDSELVKRVLVALAQQFNTEKVKVDTSVHNPARICKLYGTLARKGDSIPDRPHRRAKILEVPGCQDRFDVSGAVMVPVQRELLEELAAEVRDTLKPVAHPSSTNGTGEYDHRLDVARWLTDCGVSHTIQPTGDGWTKYLLAECPFNSDHRGKDACVMQHTNGALSAKCFHDSCANNRWQEFKTKIGKPANHHYEPPLRGRRQSSRRRAPETNGHTNGTLEPPTGDTEPEDEQDGRPNEAPDDPHRLARLCLWDRVQDAHHPGGAIPSEHLRFRYWQEQFHEWTGAAYRTIQAKEMRARVTEVVKAEFDVLNLEENKQQKARQEAEGETTKKGIGPPVCRQVTTRGIGDVLQALAGITMLPSSFSPPTWLDGKGPFSATDVLAAENALIHLPTLVQGGRDYSCPPTRNFFSFNHVNYAFDLVAPEPKGWLEFLGKVWSDDPASIGCLQEWFGYLLTPDTQQQKILTLIGPRRSGKGTIARILRALIGPDNLAGPTLSSLAMNFGLWPLLGKTVAIISDARIGRRSDLAVITERLLSISGEDALTIDRKHMAPVTAKLLTRIVILTNELPNLQDSSGALAGRMVLLHLPRSWYGKEDPKLTARLLSELPGILLWAVAGWKRLNDRGYFLQPETGRELIEELEDLSSPVGQFVSECCVLDADQETIRTDLYTCWKAWSERAGKKPGDAALLGRNLRASCHGISDGQPRVDGVQVRAYRGIGLTAVGQALLMQGRARENRHGYDQGEAG